MFGVIDGKRKRHYYKTHPATKTFQALRIFINNEIEDLKDLLEQIPMIVSHNGRLSVISFHSFGTQAGKVFHATPNSTEQ